MNNDLMNNDLPKVKKTCRAARWRYLVSRINYRDEEESSPTLTWMVRRWSHDSNDFVSDSITMTVDAAIAALRAEGEAI